MFGFIWFQSKDQIEQQKKYAAQQAQMELEERTAEVADAFSEANAPQESTTNVNVALESVQKNPFKSEILNASYKRLDNVKHHTISNDLVEIVFTTKGAQPYSVKLNKFNAYNPESPKKPKELYLMKNGWSDYSVSFELNSSIADTLSTLRTEDFVFNIVDSSATHIEMKLPLDGGGYIQQKYWLEKGNYMLKNEMTVVGLNKLVTDSTKAYVTDWSIVIPRLEKGYDSEKRYSKMDYCLSGKDEPEEIAEGKSQGKSVSSSVRWYAFQQQFFSAIVTPASPFTSSRFDVTYFSEGRYKSEGALMECISKTTSAIDPKADTLTANCEFYFGPNDYATLKSYGRDYESIIPLGSWIVSWFNRWIVIPVFDFLGKYISNYGIIILILTLLVKLLLSPLTIKSYKSTAKMQALRPEIQQINEKYPKSEDAMKKQQAMMNLYQKAGVSPLGGCLPMLLQMPILFAMFRFFPASVELRQQGFLWASDLSTYDAAIEFGGSIPLLGNHISIFALLMALSMFLYSKMNSAQMGDNGMPGMKFMSLYLMPIMMFFICNSLPAALSYYYLLSNLITMAMTWYIRKYVVTEEKVRAEMARAALKPRKKSKWQLRLEEAQRMQEQMQREKKNRRK